MESRGQIGVFDDKGQVLARDADVVAGYLETGLVEQLRRQFPDLAKPQDGNAFKCHAERP